MFFFFLIGNFKSGTEKRLEAQFCLSLEHYKSKSDQYSRTQYKTNTIQKYNTIYLLLYHYRINALSIIKSQ